VTPDPFVALGGGTCVNGGWLPPGIAPPSVPPSAPPPPVSGGCVTPDPFVGLPGLVGICNGGGWQPVPGAAGQGTMRLDGSTGLWVIAADSGTTYVPAVAVAGTFMADGLRVSFKVGLRTDLPPSSAGQTVDVLSIAPVVTLGP
jgi:hypothetical protein